MYAFRVSGFFDLWNISLCVLFNDKVILVEDHYRYYLTQLEG